METLTLAEQPPREQIDWAEHETKFEIVEHPGIIDAKQFFDRQAAEEEAWELISNWSKASSPEIFDQEYNDNSRTAIMEALTASGHLSVVEIEGSLQEIEAQMLARLLNGWDSSLPQHEQDRRFPEIVNLLYGQKVRAAIVAGELPENTAILEISDYPEALRGQKLGYRDRNMKGMVRSSHLEDAGDGHYKLIIEQASRSNATAQSTFRFMQACNVKLDQSGCPPDIAALATPLIYNTYDYADGVIDVLRLIDKHAGPGVLYGDTGTDKSRHVPYNLLRAESRRREAEVKHFTDDLAQLEKQLDGYVRRGQMTQKERTANFLGEVERILTAICTLRPMYAEPTFGKAAAPDFYQANDLVIQGRTAEAAQLLKDKAYLREEVSFCGGSISAKEATEFGLSVNSLEQLLNNGKEKWVWKKGYCVVKSCRYRHKKVEVGPCSVCRSCQEQFDNGDNPVKKAAVKPSRPEANNEPAERQKRRGMGRAALKPQLVRKRGTRLEIKRRPDQRQPA